MYLKVLLDRCFVCISGDHQITDEILCMVHYTGEPQTRRLGLIVMSTH